MLLAHDQHQLLRFAGRPYRDDHASPGCQLVEQCLWHFRRHGGDDDAVVRRKRRPPLTTVTPAEYHVAQVKLHQALFGPVLQHLDALYRKHPLDQLSQDRRLVARTCLLYTSDAADE